jgi:integrase
MQRDELRPKAASRIAAGTFASVIRAYQTSPAYLAGLARSTQRLYNDVLRIAEAEEALGGLPVTVIRPALVQAFLDGLSATPGRQKIARTALSAVQKWGLVRDLLPYPIMTGTYTIPADGGHEPWSLEHVRLAELHARADLARVVTLAVHTGQRGSDIVRMRWSDIEEQDDRQGVNVIQQKTGRRLWVPFTAELTAVLATWERRPPFFLILKPNGTTYTREHLSWHWNDERDNNPALGQLKEAGLVLHGLRATAVVRARRAGATVLEIASMFGMTEPTVARYSRLADQRDMALGAVVRLDRTAKEQKREQTQQTKIKSAS